MKILGLLIMNKRGEVISGTASPIFAADVIQAFARRLYEVILRKLKSGSKVERCFNLDQGVLCYTILTKEFIVGIIVASFNQGIGLDALRKLNEFITKVRPDLVQRENIELKYVLAEFMLSGEFALGKLTIPQRVTEVKTSKRGVENEVYNRFAYVTSSQEKNTIYNVTQRYYAKELFVRRYERAIESGATLSSLIMEKRDTIFQGNEAATSYFAHLGRHRSSVKKLCFDQAAAIAVLRSVKATERTGRAKSASKVPPPFVPSKDLASPLLNGHKANESPLPQRRNQLDLLSPTLQISKPRRDSGPLDLLNFDPTSPMTPGPSFLAPRLIANSASLQQQSLNQKDKVNSNTSKGGGEDLIDVTDLDFFSKPAKNFDLPANLSFVVREKLTMQVKENKVKDLKINGQFLLESKANKEECPPLKIEVAWPDFSDPNKVQSRSSVNLDRFALSDVKTSSVSEYIINPKVLEPDQIPLLLNTREEFNAPSTFKCVIQYRTNETVRDVEIQAILRAAKTFVNVEDIKTEPVANKVTSETVVWRSRQIKKESRGKIELKISNAAEKMVDHLTVTYRKESVLLPFMKATMVFADQQQSNGTTLPAEEKFFGEYRITTS